MPGVLITRNSGAPGDESWGMKLRGASSSNSTDPLIIVDGVEYSDGINGMRNLNPDDIESINFLKDASAAIYGSKAAGGVVLITTKKAKAGKTVVSIWFFYWKSGRASTGIDVVGSMGGCSDYCSD